MPLLVPELPIFSRGLEAAELGADRSIDQLGQVMSDLDVGAQAEEDVARLARCILLAPDATVAERGDGADAIVERDALPVARLVDAPLAGRFADLDIGQRQVVAVEQLSDLGGSGQCLALGAAVGDGLGAQPLDARPELVDRVQPAQGLMPISFWAVPPRIAMR
jgi:hypothetical protein